MLRDGYARLLAGLGLGAGALADDVACAAAAGALEVGVRVLVVLDGRLVQVADVRLAAAAGRVST